MKPTIAVLLAASACSPRVVGPGADASDASAGSTSTDTVTTDDPTAPATTGSTAADTSSNTSDPGSSTGDSGPDTTDTGSAFIIDPDGGCVSLSCDVWAQDCPRGESCVPWDAGGEGPSTGCAQSRCRAIAPEPRAPGESCLAERGPWSGLDDCALGSYCWNIDDVTLEGVCVAQCIGSEAEPVCADEALSCFVWTGSAVTACVVPCDPLAPACAEGTTCVLSAANDQAPGCVSSTLGVPSGHGTPCEPALGCGDGFACVEGTTIAACDGPYCCATLCDLDAPTCLAEEPTCAPVPGAPAGVGACGVP